MRIRPIVVNLILIVFPSISFCQVLIDVDQQLFQDYQWIYNTNIKYACKQNDNSTIIETELDKCDFINDFKMFPNPANSLVQINFSGRKAQTKVFISNLNGQLVYSEDIEGFNGFHNSELSVANFDAGIYVLTIVQNEKTFIKKLVIE